MLNLDLQVRPREGSRSQTKTPFVGDPASGEVAGRVRDRALAELLSAVVEHWEELGTDYAREDWLRAVYGTSHALGARRSGGSSRGSGGG